VVLVVYLAPAAWAAENAQKTQARVDVALVLIWRSVSELFGVMS
jgi:hypothetical protein